MGNRITQTDANGHATSFAYDQLGRRSSRTLPLNTATSETYGYDADGNLTSKKDFNGHTTTYAYDTMNRLLSKTADAFFSAGSCAGGACGATKVSFTYTATGRRLSMTDAAGIANYTYDTRDRLLTKAAPAGTLTYTYDALGNTLSLASSNSGGASMTYGYDTDNRLSSVTDASGVTSYSYDLVGNLSGYTYPNGVATSYTYDTLNRLTNIQSLCGTGTLACAPGTPISSYAYTLGAAGNRLSVAELSGRTVNYGYDDLYRLTSETVASDPKGNNGQVSYTYDNVGNRVQRNSTLPGVVATGLLNYDANDRTASDPYDQDGNLLSSGAGANVYDFENRLVQAGGVTLVYDGDGNRVQETVAGATTSYLVADQNLTGYAQVLDELQNGAVSRAYSYGLTLISQRLTANGQGLSFYGFDGHGSVRFLTGPTGAVTDTYDYDAFGILISQTGTTLNNYLFAGEQFDLALGIYYNRARHYDQRIGRFWTMDSREGGARDPISLHRYLYASANPVDRIDPSGQEDWSLAGVTAAVGNALTIASQTVLNVGRVLFGVGLALAPQIPFYIDKANYYLTWASALLFAADKTLVGLGRLSQQLADYSGPEFPEGIPARPDSIETASGCNLDRRFPAFDNWEAETGEATQQFTTSQVSTPDAFLAAVRGKLLEWRGVYDRYDVFVGPDRAGNIERIPKNAIQTKNLHVVTPVIMNWRLQDVAQRLQLLETEFEMDEIVVQENRFFKP